MHSFVYSNKMNARIVMGAEARKCLHPVFVLDDIATRYETTHYFFNPYPSNIASLGLQLSCPWSFVAGVCGIYVYLKNKR